MSTRPIIVGAGHNGLVAAAYLARAGLAPLVLERRHEVGGCAVTHELHPGFRVPALSHVCPISPEIAHDLDLPGQGLHLFAPDTTVCVPAGDRALLLSRDTATTSESLRPWSARDADRWPALVEATRDAAAAIDPLLAQPPPAIDSPSSGELLHLLQTGRRIRALGRQRLYQFLRWAPMPVADFAAEWCESEPLRAAICARGIFGIAAGPRSAGTMAGWLLQAAQERGPAGAPTLAIGGPASLAAALAVSATSAGAEIRLDTRVTSILVGDSGVRAVVLENGDELPATTVVSGADPQHTLLALVDPVRLPLSYRLHLERYRSAGVVAKVNLALGALPSFPSLTKNNVPPEQALAGRVLIGPSVDDLERAYDCCKYGRISERPWLEVAFPSLSDPSLAPRGKHVASIYAQWMPRYLRNGEWESNREPVGDLVVRMLAEHAPDLPGKIVAGQVLTPADLEAGYGLTGGHVFHGEHALDQLFVMRPALGWAQYRTPVTGLYLCSAGTHPGGGLTGRPGALAARTVLKDLNRR